jgi:hypothetical protein
MSADLFCVEADAWHQQIATAHDIDWYLLLSYYCPGYLAITITFLRVYTREVPAASSIQLIHQFTVNAYALFEWLHIVLH